jgi:hypothetical protein
MEVNMRITIVRDATQLSLVEMYQTVLHHMPEDSNLHPL